MAHLAACRALAAQSLRDYRLNPEEREDETRRLAEQIASVVDEALEPIADRKIPRSVATTWPPGLRGEE